MGGAMAVALSLRRRPWQKGIIVFLVKDIMPQVQYVKEMFPWLDIWQVIEHICLSLELMFSVRKQTFSEVSSRGNYCSTEKEFGCKYYHPFPGERDEDKILQ